MELTGTPNDVNDFFTDSSMAKSNVSGLRLMSFFSIQTETGS